MVLLSIFVFNLILFAFLVLYCKFTCGINKCSKHLVGKVVIVTGGSSGIGFETAKDLAARGARVILACKNDGREIVARDKIIAASGNQDVHYRQLDLASLTSVRKFAQEFLKAEKQLDILINNAGVIETKLTKSEDGLLLGMQVNHFGPFLLTNLLLPLLKSSAPSRIINVSSMAHKWGEIDFDNLNMEKETGNILCLSALKLYNNTKLCNVLMTVELERQLRGTGVTANCLHPGAVRTSIIVSDDSALLKFFNGLPILFKSAWEGAQTSIYLAVSPEVSEISGEYFSDCHISKMSTASSDPEMARKLWEVSKRLVALQ